MTRSPSLHLLVPLLVLIVVTGCGGGGGGDAAGVDVGLAITFPPDGSSTPEGVLRVVGTTVRGADALTVGGVTATSTDGFLTWQADLPLVPGPNSIDLVVTKSGRSGRAKTLLIRHEDDRPRPILAFSFGADGSFLYRSRYRPSPLARVFPDGRMTVTDVGYGNYFSTKPMIVYDALRNRAILALSGGPNLQVVDLVSGSVIDTIHLPQGDVSGLAIEPLSGTTYIAANEVPSYSQPTGCYLYELGAQATAPTLISGPSSAAPAGNLSLFTIDQDASSQRVVGWDFLAESLVDIDLLTGQRSFLSMNATLSGYVIGLTLVPGGQTARILDNIGNLIEVDLATGSVTSIPVPSFPSPTDPQFSSVFTGQALWVGLEAESATSTLLIRSDRVFRLHADGSHEEFWRAGRGERPSLEWETFHRLAFDSQRNCVLADSHGTMLSVNCSSGDVEIVPNQIAGPPRPWVKDMRYDPVNDRLLYASPGAAGLYEARGIYGLSPAAGPQTRLFQPPFASWVASLDHDPIADQIVVMSPYAAIGVAGLVVARYDTMGNQVAYDVYSALGIDSYFFHLNAATDSLFGLVTSTNMISGLDLATGTWTPILPRSTDGLPAQNYVPSLVMHYDETRDELTTLEWNLLRVVNIGTGQTRQKRLSTGDPDVDPALLGLTRDPKTGMFYVGSSTHPYIMVLETETLGISYIHY